MTPGAKAKQLVNKFMSYGLHNKYMGRTSARQCALILVDEILDEDVYDMSEELFDKRIEYWLEVKQEIEKQ
jgi:hypothetical protein